MTPFELDNRNFERLTQSHQLSTTSTLTTEELFETIQTADVYMPSHHSMIEPIVNQNFGNKFQHQNGPN